MALSDRATADGILIPCVVVFCQSSQLIVTFTEFICLSAGLQTFNIFLYCCDFHATWWEDATWAKEEPDSFWTASESRGR